MEPRRNLAWLAAHHFGKIRCVSFLAWCSPAVWLLGEWLFGSLGVNPLNRLLHFSGGWALAALLVTLAVTPARRLSLVLSRAVHARYGKRVSDWNWLIRLRRQFGLFVFFYAGLHVAIYVVFDASFDPAALRDDVLERPFIGWGLVAFVLLIPLAATSNRAAMKALGRHWQRLHGLVYPIVAMALAHVWLQLKVGHHVPGPLVALLMVVVVMRLLAWRLGDRGAGIEVAEREREKRQQATRLDETGGVPFVRR